MDKTIHLIPPADAAIGSEMGAALLALNNAHEKELSFLAAARLAELVSEAFCAFRIGNLDALLISFDQSADYDSPNFIWFRERFDRFVYVDRVVVANHARGRGLARKLYERLFNAARDAGHDRIVCEVNSDPPNPGSDAFHASLGFEELGFAEIHGGAKTVRYLQLKLA